MILIIGLPNAGKTTYSANYSNVVHYDEIKGGRHRRDKVIEMVKENNNLCIEGVYAKIADRKKLVNASKQKNICIWLDTPMDVCIEREINGRKRPIQMIKWCAEKFEPPTYSEGWDDIIVIKDTTKVSE